jgi:hypothetical protein
MCTQVFFPHNDKIKVVGQSFGNHGGDWEHVTVRSTRQGEMLSIYYAAHKSDEGVWVKAKDVHFDARGQSNRPVVFVAKAGHGAYPAPGTWKRKDGPEKFLGIDDDVSVPGRTWAPSAVIVTGGGMAGETSAVSTIPNDPAGGYAELPAPFIRDVQATSGLVNIGPAMVVIRASPWVNWDCYWGRGTFSQPDHEKFDKKEKAGENPVSPQRQGWYNNAEGKSFDRDVMNDFR